VSPAPDLLERFRRDCETLTGPEPGKVGLAVSGGPDSIAMLFLAAAAFPGEVAAATVDHGLRPEAASEARFVGELCSKLGIPHRHLKVEVDPSRSSVQRAAREARYAALAQWCEDEDRLWLATAHHADDQAETLLMRLIRGAGVAGLAGIRPAMPLPGSQARLIRPLLGWRRETLATVVEQAGIRAIDDPSNRDERYDRARLRRRLRDASWIEAEPLARSASALAEAEEALGWTAERLSGERISIDGAAYLLDPREIPAELVRRMVLRLINRESPRGDAVQKLIATLVSGGTATLGGYRCRGGEIWRFEPEAPRSADQPKKP
jgi:tRNA(Ile)-lysidine synthase